ncbi:MAG: polyphenol oxidase family protein [bacterium]
MEGAEPATDPRRGGEVVEHFRELGIDAFTTGRDAGSFGTQSDEPVQVVMGRWSALRRSLGTSRLATATQVHGDRVVVHSAEWRGWLRGDAADGHLAPERGTAMAVTIADCVPVFIAHASGATAVLHSGWRGTAARITARAIERFTQLGISASELRAHCGPAICGQCYEVSADVAAQLTGHDPGRAVNVDLRAIIAGHARDLGVRDVTVSSLCTRCDNDRFYSHRAGDAGRQLAVIVGAS